MATMTRAAKHVANDIQRISATSKLLRYSPTLGWQPLASRELSNQRRVCVRYFLMRVKDGVLTVREAQNILRRAYGPGRREPTAESRANSAILPAVHKPFFLWHSSTRLHFKTHLSPKWQGKTGYGLTADGMAELDNAVGANLKKLDELKIAGNTIVVFTSDNGPEIFTWPDGGNTPFKGEKARRGKAAFACRRWCAGLES